MFIVFLNLHLLFIRLQIFEVRNCIFSKVFIEFVTVLFLFYVLIF